MLCFVVSVCAARRNGRAAHLRGAPCSANRASARGCATLHSQGACVYLGRVRTRGGCTSRESCCHRLGLRPAPRRSRVRTAAATAGPLLLTNGGPISTIGLLQGAGRVQALPSPYLLPINGLCLTGCVGHASVHAIADSNPRSTC
jgi:hypothetical protein